MSVNPSPRRLPAQEAYRLWAQEYDASVNPLLSLEKRMLAPLFALAAGCDVVDLGCGTGRSIVEFAQAGARSIVGIDFSREMLECAWRKRPPLARLVEADCRDTQLPARSCDWILASFLLSYLNRLEAFAQEVARISRSGAFVLIVDVHPAARSYGWKRTFRNSEGIIEIQTYSYEIYDLHRAMQFAGFDLVYLKEAGFGPEELALFSQVGRPELYRTVENLPVLFAAGYQRDQA
jgi:ubiquinone/menaquinone biosynthesis C-methylase UbiE